MIAVVGASGSGKSTSLRHLDPTETFIINVAGKPLPIRGANRMYTQLTQDPETKKFSGNMIKSKDVQYIGKILNLINKGMPHIKTVIIEDAQYIMSFEMMERSAEKGYDKFSQIAKNFYDVLQGAMSMRDDLNVCFMTHSENIGTDLNPNFKMKTLGN